MSFSCDYNIINDTHNYWEDAQKPESRYMYNIGYRYVIKITCRYRIISISVKSLINVSLICTCTCVCMSVFLISSCGAPLVQTACYLALHSSLFGPDSAVNYDYIITNSITCNSLLICSRCLPNGAHTNHCWANLSHTSKCIKNSDACVLC